MANDLFGLEAVQPADPGCTALYAHLRSARNQAALDAGKWAVVSLKWPLLVVEVRAGDDHHVGLRLDLTGYPAAAPTGAPWDVATSSPLPAEMFPTGVRTSQVFNPNWNISALYMPYDRVAREGHDGWRDQHPDLVWNSASTVVEYLALVSSILRDANVPARAA